MPKIETRRSNILDRLAKDGWIFDRHGSQHDIYRHPDRLGIVSVPRHRNVTPGVARSIAKAAGWTGGLA